MHEIYPFILQSEKKNRWGIKLTYFPVLSRSINLDKWIMFPKIYRQDLEIQ